MVSIPLLVRLIFAFFLVVGFAACGRKEGSEPRSAEQVKAEKAASEKSVRDNAIWGEQVKALDKAKDVQKTMEK